MHDFLLVSSMLLAVFLSGCGPFSLNCRDTNCSDYPTQKAAQLAFEADPACHADLDADHDGMACEENTGDEAH
ncbi:excalibur calcium-binding domain-containing protein [Myxococcus sp. K38C18041901]|uniref:excalibur calcium-binding domain-containing protein n=1 Tax=Myxococcus guangdongensis TaxID=2906760 RepID=UPI0020A6F6C4|nr:excalibur calcium-binding domain-containing protein [Myxococcus guangdongensis]MCP3061201.1 excalibur calcium-binding domain-containing protein [Myxococcus guangdongensis]